VQAARVKLKQPRRRDGKELVDVQQFPLAGTKTSSARKVWTIVY
jgi:hypothetical protein